MNTEAMETVNPPKYRPPDTAFRLFLALVGRALLLEHLLHNLLLLDQKGAHNAVTHAVAAS